MIAYGKDDIEHFVAHLNAGKPRDEKKAGEEWSTFNLVHPYPFYSPSNFVRIGLFFLTLFVVLLIFAFLWLIAGTPGSDSALGLLCLIVGSMSMIGLEYFVRKRKHYQSGIDEAFHCSIVILFTSCVLSIFHLPSWLSSLVAAAIALFLFLRYISVLQAGIAVVCMFSSFAMLAGVITNAFVYALPLMLGAMACYYLIMFYRKSIPAVYESGALFAGYCFLLTTVFFSNFLCIGELGYFDASNVAIAGIYKVTTVLIPAVLLVLGIAKKDLVAIHVAVVAGLFAVYSVYVFIGSAQPFIWMTICGLIVVLTVVILMKWLKADRGGFVYRKKDTDEFQKCLEILAAAGASQKGPPAAGGFGGGDFGGGGATGEF